MSTKQRSPLRTTILAVMLLNIALSLPPSSWADGIRAYSQNASPETSHTDWMKWVPDDTRLSIMSIPGSHDTMALNGGDLIETQDLELSEQLESGLRYFDIRVQMKDDEFHIVHGISDQFASFDDVLEACNTFLEAHPSETILLQMNDTGVPEKVACCIQYNPVNCELSKEQIFYQKYYTQTNGRYFWRQSLNGITNPSLVPILGDVRGKIVLVQPWTSDTGNWYGLSGSSRFESADYYNLRTIFDRDNKWNSDQTFLAYTDGDTTFYLAQKGPSDEVTLRQNPADPAYFYKYGLNGSSEAIGVYPNAVALYINPRVFKYLFERNQSRTTGVLQMDFPGSALISATIAHNLKYATNADRKLIKDSFNTIFGDTCYIFRDADYDDLGLKERAQRLSLWLAHILPSRGESLKVQDYWSVVVKKGDGGFANWAVLEPINPGASQTLFEQSDWIDDHSYVAMNAVSKAVSVTTNELLSFLTVDKLTLKPEHATVVNAAGAAGDCRDRARALRTLVAAHFPTVNWNVAVSRSDALGMAQDTSASVSIIAPSAVGGQTYIFYYYVWAGSVRDTNILPVLDVGGPYVIGEGSSSGLKFDLSGTVDPDHSGVLTYWKDLDNDGLWDSGFSDPIYTLSSSEAGRFANRGTYQVRLGVSDNQSGLTEPDKIVSAITTVTVTNVPPKLNLGTATEDLVVGNILFRQGSFLDSGENPWKVTVNYDDGTPTANLAFDNLKTFQLNHLYSTAGNRNVTVLVDDGVATAKASFLVRVLPIGERWLSMSGTVNAVGEGSPVILDAKFFYPGFGGPPNNEEVRIVWGDNTPDEYPVVNGALGTNTLSVQHVYLNNLADPNTNYTAMVYFGNWTQRSFAFTVTNVAPQFTSISAPASIPEGVPFSLGYTITDPGKESRVFKVYWGDGTQSAQPDTRHSGSFGQPHRYVQVGTNTLTIQVTDIDGATAVETRPIIVTDEAPKILEFYGLEEQRGIPVGEGDTLSVEGYFTSFNSENDHLTVQVDWGDGRLPSAATFSKVFGATDGRNHFQASHVYLDNQRSGPWTATVIITDEEGNVTKATTPLTVFNRPPVVDPIANLAIPDGRVLSSSGHITDPGTSDTFTGTVNYGDGSGVQSLTIIGKYYQLNHTYAANGIYTVTVNVVDDDNGSASQTMKVLGGPLQNLLVTNTSDFGPGSLRQAVLDANTLSSDSTAFPNAYSEIRFAAALSGETITLTSGPLVSTRRTRFDASDLTNGIHVSGNNASRIFEISSDNSVVLDSLRLTAGFTSKGGGAILVNSGARLFLNRCSISDSTTTDRGGGIFFVKGAGLTINESTISGCRARDGGGVYFYGLGGKTLEVNNSTFTGNSASGSLDSAGGAIFNESGRVAMYHSTIVSNSAAGAASRGGGVHSSTGATLDFNNSIAAANTGAIAANVSGPNAGTKNLISSDPMLYPLGDYGGPTPTMPPRPGSPAIDAVTNISFPIITTTIAHWRLGEDEAGATNGSSTIATTDLNGGMLNFNRPVSYSDATSRTAAGWLDSRLGVSLSAGTYGTNELITDLKGSTAIIDNFGIELWVKPSDSNGYKCLAYNGDTSASGWGLYQFGDSFGGLFGGVAFIGLGSSAVIPGAWSHVALVRDGGVTKFYVDGLLKDTATAAPNVPTGRFAVGAPPQLLNLQFFDGALDEVRVFTFQPGQFTPDSLSFHPRAPFGLSISPGSENGLRLENDQRGYPRVSGFGADIGAVEIDQRIVRVTDDEGNGSLRRTLAELSSPGIATFANALADQTILLTSGQLTLDKYLTIDASALPGGIDINGNNSSRVFEIASNTIVELDLVTITNGFSASGQGGGIRNNGSLTLNESTISGNRSKGAGGGLFINSGAVTLNNCTVSGNSATAGNGGGISNPSGKLTLNQCTLTANVSSGSGGAVGFGANGGLVEVNQSTISRNTAANQGGGFYHLGGSLIVFNSIVAGNSQSAGDEVNGSVEYRGCNVVSGDPLLAPLAHYGGPTLTMPPLPGSRAIDGAGSSLFTKDQRGAARPTGSVPDIGAVEAFPFSSLPLVDADNDGADDRMELGYFGNLATITSTSDFDGDKASDLSELANMTNPMDPNDSLRITLFSPAAGFDAQNSPLFDVTIRTFPGLSYTLQTNAALGIFTDVPGTTFTATNHSQTLQIQLSPERDFLRARRD